MAAGGTGGHIYPGIAISDKLKEFFPDAEIIFVGSHVGMEKDIVPKAGYKLELTRARGFERGFSKETLEAIKGIFDSRKDAKNLLKKYQPDLVIGTGGFTSAMLLRQASKKKIPTMIHEQNAYPGRSNKLTGKTVDRIAISFPQAEAYFDKHKTFLAGNPIREEFKHIDRKKAREKLGLKDNQRLIIFMGGSQGAQSINKAAVDVIKKLQNEDIVFYHLTGNDQYEEIKAALKDYENENLKIFGYYDDIPNLLAAGDLIVSRSGAMSVAEIAACGIPSILVPYPLAAGDHQTFNAKALSDNKAAIIIEDKNLSSEKLYDTILSLLNNDNILKEMRKNTFNQRIIDADERFCREALKLVTEKTSKK